MLPNNAKDLFKRTSGVQMFRGNEASDEKSYIVEMVGESYPGNVEKSMDIICRNGMFIVRLWLVFAAPGVPRASMERGLAC
jgi:hypothetical protein